MVEQYKRNIAYKMRIGGLLAGKPLLEGDRLKSLDVGDKQVVRVNLIARKEKRNLAQLH